MVQECKHRPMVGYYHFFDLDDNKSQQLIVAAISTGRLTNHDLRSRQRQKLASVSTNCRFVYWFEKSFMWHILKADSYRCYSENVYK